MAAPKPLKNTASVRKFVRNAVKTLERKHKPVVLSNGKSSVEHLIYVICAQGNPERRSTSAIKELLHDFAGWNEVRVSSVLEIADVLRQHEITKPIQKAEQVIHALGRSVGDNKFKIDEFTRDRAEDIRVWMARKLGLPGYVIADFLFTALSYTRIPLDDAVGRVLQRLGLVANKMDYPRVEKLLSEGLTGKECAHITGVLELHAAETCFERDPACPRCPLLNVCPEGQARIAAAEAAAKAPPPPPPPPEPPPPKPGSAKPGSKLPVKPGAASAKPAPGKPAPAPAKPVLKPSAPHRKH